MFRLAKHGTLVGLLRFSPSFLSLCAASNRANLAFKTTIIEDTHLTLAGIPLKVEANYSLIFLPLQTYEKKFAEFPFLFIFIIPWSKQGIIDMNRNGKSAIFFSYVCNGKKIKELFASTLDRKPASVRCVSSMIVVSLLLAAHANKKYGESRRSPTFSAMFC